MSLTLDNACEVLDHCVADTPAGGFTRTSHHAGHLAPGDLWRPDRREGPHTITELRRSADQITLVDQTGTSYRYRTDAILPTAVADPLVPRPRDMVYP